MMTKSRILLIGLTLVAALVLAACGGNDDPTPMPTPTPLPAAEVSTTAPTPTLEPTKAPAAESADAEQPDSPLQPESPLQAESPLPTPTPVAVAYEADTADGLAQVRGRLIHTLTNQPIVDTNVRLAELYCAPDGDPDAREESCIWGLDDAQSPYARTDANGGFVFNEVLPGEYVLFVGVQSVKDGNAIALGEDGVAIIYSPVADEGLDLGEVKVIFPPISTEE